MPLKHSGNRNLDYVPRIAASKFTNALPEMEVFDIDRWDALFPHLEIAPDD
jgi:hypothetical protein